MEAMSTKVDSTLPEKSSHLYKKSYNQFMEWRSQYNISTFSEDTLLGYFKYLVRKFKPSSLWVEYSKLKSTLSLYNQIDISKYPKVLDFLKSKQEGFEAKKAHIFTAEELERFIKEAPDAIFLQYKVAVIFGIMGACRRQELHDLRFRDVIDTQNSLIVQIRNSKNKVDRIFHISGKYYEICKKYMQYRPNCSNSRFFLRCFDGKCTNQTIGINTFGNMGKIVAEHLKLPNPELYTGQCFRRTSVNLFDSGGDLLRKWQPTATHQNSEKTENHRHLEMEDSSSSERSQLEPRPCLSLMSKTPRQLVSDSPMSESKTKSRPQVLTEESQESLEESEGPQNRTQCRFCGDFKECAPVVHKPYLMGNKIELALNHLRLELDFSINSLPKTICRDCDTNLLATIEFIKQVNKAQFSLVNISPKTTRSVNNCQKDKTTSKYENDCQNVETVTRIKDELESNDEVSYESKELKVDLLTLGETVYAKETHKRKYNKLDTDTMQKKAKVKEEVEINVLNTELIIKEETVDSDDTMDGSSNSEGDLDSDDTDISDDNPSEMKPAKRALNYLKKKSFSDRRMNNKTFSGGQCDNK